MSRTVACLAAFIALLYANPARAQDAACIKGSIPAGEWSEFDQRLKETGWDYKGGLQLQSAIGGVQLFVLDSEGRSVCEETANNTTACRFRVDLTLVDVFNIKVDNTANRDAAAYKICAF
ncbi:MAG TPA: hypothetical protein VFV47_02265 [Hyphomicrobiaceae bacterium]|nr:hypothetical protein [Hyphomicrobiaceae bacterium]